jgi:hypothetical protein
VEGLRRLVFVGVVVSLCGAAVGTALASRSAPAAAPVHKLVPYPTAECLKEKLADGKPKNKLIGVACVDYRFGIYPERWTTLTNGRAVFDDPGYKNSFTWKVPATIGPGPAPLPLSITALDKSGGRSCPGIGIRGIGVKTGESYDFPLPVCADKINNPATSSASRTLHLMPPGSGPATLSVGIAPGMVFYYRYVPTTTATTGTTAGSTTKKCPTIRKTSMVRSPSQEPRCTFVLTYRFSFGRREASGDYAPNITLAGQGKLKGTNIKRLEPQEIASDDDENLIKWRDGSRSIVFDVKSAEYRNTAKSGTQLALVVTVFRSNVPACPKGKEMALVVESSPNTSVILPDCGIVQPNSPTGRADVDVEVKTD